MKHLARYKNIIAALVIVFLSLVILRNIHSYYDLKRKELVEAEARVLKAKETIAEWRSLNGKYNSLRGDFLAKDTILFKKFIEEKARAANIELPSLRLSSVDRELYWEVKVNINTTCDYDDFVRFIDSLAERNIEAASVNLRSSGTKVLVNADIKGVVLK